jgi:hypothetical protein
MTANFKATQNCLDQAAKQIGNPGRFSACIKQVEALIKRSEAQINVSRSVSALTASDRDKMTQDIELLRSFLSEHTA